MLRILSTNSNRLVFALLFTLVVSATVACSKYTEPTTVPGFNRAGTVAAGKQVFGRIQNSTHESLTIKAGDMVVWSNVDNITHTVTSGTPGSPTSDFDSGNLTGGGTYSHTFSAAGTFPYFCKIHTSMTATITVNP